MDPNHLQDDALEELKDWSNPVKKCEIISDFIRFQSDFVHQNQNYN